jgi:citrate lyase subunit beta/citryl-CoA lyase
LGLIHCYEILRSSDRIIAAVFGGEDLSLDLGLLRTEGAHELAYARQKLSVAARAAGVQAIDMVYPNIDNEAGLAANTREGRGMGYRGKQVIHPKQVLVVNQVLSPTREEVAEAEKIVRVFEEALDEGKGALALEGEMIDRPIYERARRLLDLAKELNT